MKGRIRHLDDWVAETPESIAARLESAKSAQGQARRTMGIMSIISMMMLIASYNAYLSYDTTWILNLAQRRTGRRDDRCRRAHGPGAQGLGRVSKCAGAASWHPNIG